MDYKHLIAGALAFSLAACGTACGSKSSSSSSRTETTTASQEESTTNTTAADSTEPTSEEELIPPVPAEATDPNTVTFDDGDFSFAAAKVSDDDCAQGEVSVVEVQGNKMLKFTDDQTVTDEGKVQKIEIHPAALIGQENLGKVRRIEFDVYADALAEDYQNLDGEFLKVPGTISCGGGTVTAALDSEGKGKWYDFAGFEGGEYNFDFSGPVHGTFKFLLAAGGQCWDDTMEDANFLIMRWGVENVSNFYVDNIVFYDENDQSLPITKPSAAGNNGSEATEPEIISTEELPDGGKKVTMSNGEVHVFNADGVEDLDQFEQGSETPAAPTTNSSGETEFDQDGNQIL